MLALRQYQERFIQRYSGAWFDRLQAGHAHVEDWPRRSGKTTCLAYLVLRLWANNSDTAFPLTVRFYSRGLRDRFAGVLRGILPRECVVMRNYFDGTLRILGKEENTSPKLPICDDMDMALAHLSKVRGAYIERDIILIGLWTKYQDNHGEIPYILHLTGYSAGAIPGMVWAKSVHTLWPLEFKKVVFTLLLVFRRCGIHGDTQSSIVKHLSHHYDFVGGRLESFKSYWTRREQSSVKRAIAAINKLFMV